MSNSVIVKRNKLDKPILAVHSVIFKSNTNSFWSGGMRSEPIQVGNVNFYYRVNKDATASFMIMFSLNSIKTIEKVPLSDISSIDDLISRLQTHFNNFVGKFSVNTVEDNAVNLIEN